MVTLVALYFMHYNFCRVHKSLRVTPAMQANLTDHIWSIGELCALMQPKKSTLAIARKATEKSMILKALGKNAGPNASISVEI